MYSAVEQNLRAAMRCYANVGDAGEVREYPGVVVASTGLNVAVFNSAMLSGPASSLEAALETADVHFRARKLGWTFWLCEDLIRPEIRGRELHSIFRAKRMFSIAEPPGMYAERIVPNDSAPVGSAQMTFAKVNDERTRDQFAHISSVVFSLPFSTSQVIYGSPGLWQPPSYGWIGYVKGKAVSVVTIVIAAGAIGVYSLGTLPQHQRCGYGETLLRHALSEAHRESSFSRFVLQATPFGLQLYRRLGFEVVTRFSIFMREGCGAF